MGKGMQVKEVGPNGLDRLLAFSILNRCRLPFN